MQMGNIIVYSELSKKEKREHDEKLYQATSRHINERVEWLKKHAGDYDQHVIDRNIETIGKYFTMLVWRAKPIGVSDTVLNTYLQSVVLKVIDILDKHDRR